MKGCGRLAGLGLGLAEEALDALVLVEVGRVQGELLDGCHHIRYTASGRLFHCPGRLYRRLLDLLSALFLVGFFDFFLMILF